MKNESPNAFAVGSFANLRVTSRSGTYTARFFTRRNSANNGNNAERATLKLNLDRMVYIIEGRLLILYRRGIVAQPLQNCFDIRGVAQHLLPGRTVTLTRTFATMIHHYQSTTRYSVYLYSHGTRTLLSPRPPDFSINHGVNQSPYILPSLSGAILFLPPLFFYRSISNSTGTR